MLSAHVARSPRTGVPVRKAGWLSARNVDGQDLDSSRQGDRRRGSCSEHAGGRCCTTEARNARRSCRSSDEIRVAIARSPMPRSISVAWHFDGLYLYNPAGSVLADVDANPLRAPAEAMAVAEKIEAGLARTRPGTGSSRITDSAARCPRGSSWSPPSACSAAICSCTGKAGHVAVVPPGIWPRERRAPRLARVGAVAGGRAPLPAHRGHSRREARRPRDDRSPPTARAPRRSVHRRGTDRWAPPVRRRGRRCPRGSLTRCPRPASRCRRHPPGYGTSGPPSRR